MSAMPPKKAKASTAAAKKMKSDNVVYKPDDWDVSSEEKPVSFFYTLLYFKDNRDR